MRLIAFAAAIGALASAVHAETPETTAPKPPANLIAALEAAGLDPRTKVEGGSVQVVLGQRAVFHLDADGKPVLNDVEAGRVDLATANGAGETYKGPGVGKLAFALDSSPEKRQSIMKVWNGLARPVAYEVEITALRRGQLMKRMAAPPTATPACSARSSAPVPAAATACRAG